MSPYVSIIVPAYNAEPFLDKCIESLVTQTMKNIEIIIIDDGSTDATRVKSLMYAMKDLRIKVYHQENKGLGAARNAGLRMAKGDYVCFIDADDWVDKEFVSKLYSNAYVYNADIAMGDIVRAIPDEELGFIYKDFVKVNKVVTAENYLQKYSIADVPRRNYVVNKLYRRRSLIDNNLWFEEGVAFEDILWSTKVIYLLKRLVTTKDAKYYYRYNNISLMIGDSEKGYKDYHTAQQKALKFRQSLDMKIKNIQHYEWTTKSTYKLFGKVILKIETYMDFKLYYLLGKWLIAIKKRRTNG